MAGHRRMSAVVVTALAGPPARPGTVADLVEGGTLGYLITIAGKFRIFVLGSANLNEQALAGVRPDLAIVPAGGGDLRGYADRLMRALGDPTWVVPSHWDDFDLPLSQPARDWGALRNLQDALAAASPKSTFVRLKHAQSFTP